MSKSPEGRVVGAGPAEEGVGLQEASAAGEHQGVEVAVHRGDSAEVVEVVEAEEEPQSTSAAAEEAHP